MFDFNYFALRDKADWNPPFEFDREFTKGQKDDFNKCGPPICSLKAQTSTQAFARVLQIKSKNS